MLFELAHRMATVAENAGSGDNASPAEGTLSLSSWKYSHYFNHVGPGNTPKTITVKCNLKWSVPWMSQIAVKFDGK